jgi:hypothetical protein
MTTGARFINYDTNQIADYDTLFTTDFTAAIAAAVSGNLPKYAIVVVIDGVTSTPTTGIKGDIFIPWLSTITRWTLLADQAGSAQLDLWMVPYASYPATVANTITGSAKPLFAAATNGQSSTLTGWTTAVPAGSTIRFNLDSITTCVRVTLILELTKI